MAEFFEVTVKGAALDPAGVHAGLLRAMQKLTLEMLREGFINATGRFFKVRSGNLRGSLIPEVTDRGSEIEGKVGTDVPYGAYMEYGTRPHLILPKTRKALRWASQVGIVGAKSVSTRRGPVLAGGREVRGGFVFARVVHHPGTSPRPFLRTALADVSGHAEEVIQAEVAAAIAGGKEPS